MMDWPERALLKMPMRNMYIKLQVSNIATDQEIQDALHQLFNSSPQGNQGPQSPSILSDKSPQGPSQPTDGDASPEGMTTKPTIVAATAISKIQLDKQFKNSMYSFIQHGIPYAEILEELSTGARQIRQNNLIFNQMNELLFVHDQNQDTDLNFWKTIVPDNFEIKEQMVQELHNTPYSTHPKIQRTRAKMRRPFYWKDMLADIRQFVQNCPMCQMEKYDHIVAKGKLQSTQILET